MQLYFSKVGKRKACLQKQNYAPFLVDNLILRNIKPLSIFKNNIQESIIHHFTIPSLNKSSVKQ